MARFVCLTAVLLLTGCQGDGNLNAFGYSTKPPFDPDIKSVYIPEFQNSAVLETTPYRGITVDITRAVVKELGSRPGAPRVVSDPERADTELIGSLMSIQKRMLNQNQQGLSRETELTFVCNVVWRDLRSGKIMTNRRRPKTGLPPAPQFDPNTLPPLPNEKPENEVPVPVTVVASGRILQEVGETNATAEQMAINDLAKRIVNMMEIPW